MNKPRVLIADDHRLFLEGLRGIVEEHCEILASVTDGREVVSTATKLNPDIIFLGVDQGATLSVNGGLTWSSWYNQPTAQLFHVITDNRFPYWVYGAQQES